MIFLDTLFAYLYMITFYIQWNAIECKLYYHGKNQGKYLSKIRLTEI